MRVEILDPEHVYSSWRAEDGKWVWTFVLDERRTAAPA